MFTQEFNGIGIRIDEILPGDPDALFQIPARPGSYPHPPLVRKIRVPGGCLDLLFQVDILRQDKFLVIFIIDQFRTDQSHYHHPIYRVYHFLRMHVFQLLTLYAFQTGFLVIEGFNCIGDLAWQAAIFSAPGLQDPHLRGILVGDDLVINIRQSNYQMIRGKNPAIIKISSGQLLALVPRDIRDRVKGILQFNIPHLQDHKDGFAFIHGRMDLFNGRSDDPFKSCHWKEPVTDLIRIRGGSVPAPYVVQDLPGHQPVGMGVAAAECPVQHFIEFQIRLEIS